MKALTIWQPWASLLACGAKIFETRSWATRYRGQIAIHAAKTWCHRYSCEVDGDIFAPAVDAALWPGVDFHDYACEYDTWEEELPRGAIIAIAELVGCWHIVHNPGTNIDIAKHIPVGAESMTNDKHAPGFGDYFVPTEQEMLFGNWTPGRYAWEIANVKVLDTPIPAKGAQGLWNWEATL